MYINAFDIKYNELLTADICIIGAGAAGITLANEFKKFSNKRVLLIESGGFDYNNETQNLYEGENISFNDFKLENTRLRFFGGTTNHWGGMCRPLDPIDFIKRKDIHDIAWPIIFSELEPFYKRAHTYCQLGPFQYNEDFWLQQPEFNPIFSKNNKVKTSIIQYSPPTRFGTVYRDNFKNDSNINVLLNANVLEIICNSYGTSVQKLKVSSLNNNIFFIQSNHFILATGGMEVPRLLLLSNSVQNCGLGNQNDLVGRYYMDHLGLWGGKIHFTRPISIKSMYFNLRTVIKRLDNANVGALLSPTDIQLEENTLPNFRCLLSPSFGNHGIDSAKSLFTSLSNAHVPDNLGHHLSNILRDFDDVLNVGLKTLFNLKNNVFDIKNKLGNATDTAALGLNFEQIPTRNSRITLSSTKDRFDQSRIKLDWRLTNRNKTAVFDALKIISSAKCQPTCRILSIIHNVIILLSLTFLMSLPSPYSG